MKDHFDEFLKKEIEKSKSEIPDDGFSDRVIETLPQPKKQFIGRQTIIIIFSAISVLIFLLLNGINQFISGIANLINGVIYNSPINLEFLFVFIIFSIMALSISFIEFRRSAI